MNSGTATCSSDIFSVDGVPYSKVCGKIRAYQVRFPDAFGLRNPSDINIDANYVDGVSLTHGSSQRQHIWTFSCAANEDDQEGGRNVPAQTLLYQIWPHLLHLLWGMTISVIKLWQVDSLHKNFTIVTHCGMELAVVPRAHAAPSIVLHGSTSNCHRPPLMI